MNRFLSLILVLSLLAPMVTAMPFQLEDSPAFSWFDSVQSLIAWAVSWLSPASEPASDGLMESTDTTTPSPDKNGGFVVPSGATDDSPPTNDHGGFVVPSG